MKNTYKKIVNLTLASNLLCSALFISSITFAANKAPTTASSSANLSMYGIAAGTYTISHGPFYPLLAVTNDAGLSWNYPHAISNNLETTIDSSFLYGVLRRANCTKIDNNGVCLAFGSFCKNEDCTSQAPLIAIGQNDLTAWNYPHSVFEDLTLKIDKNLQRGFFVNGLCQTIKNQNLCLAVGVFTNPVQNPLLARSIDHGETWTYPKSIFQNLTQTLDSSYSSGIFQSVSCNQSLLHPICIATGAFCSGTTCRTELPLLAISNDAGENWQYPGSIFKDLKTIIDKEFQSGEFVNSACTGHDAQSVCIAVGRYFKTDLTYNPLLVLTRTSGRSWSYPSIIYKDLDTVLGHHYLNGSFRAASCTGNNAKARCIAVGFFSTTKNTTLPLVALTKNGGESWTYTPFFYTKLKTTVNRKIINATLTSANCIGKDKQSICMTAGSFCTDKACEHQYPLIAVTIDGGRTWNYPTSVYKNLFSVIDSHLKQAFFSDINCNGSESSLFCVASGQYSTGHTTYPLVAYSTDKGASWFYPDYIFKNLTAKINPRFISGVFDNMGTSLYSYHLNIRNNLVGMTEKNKLITLEQMSI